MKRNHISRLAKGAKTMFALALLLVANVAFAADDAPRKIDTRKVPPIDSLAISSDSLLTSGCLSDGILVAQDHDGEDNHKLVRGRRSLVEMIESIDAETQLVLYEYIEPLEAHYGVKIASE